MIQTGDVLRLESTDLEKYPLPNVQLLNLQWALQIALHACANAEALKILFSPTDDEDTTIITTAEALSLSDYEYEDVSAGDHASNHVSEHAALDEFLLERACDLNIIANDNRDIWRTKLADTPLKYKYLDFYIKGVS
jgi:hypothetical protein